MAFVVTVSPAALEAKTPGKTYCFNKVCHRVKTIEETAREVGRNSVVLASFYDDAKVDRFNPSNLTSSGALFDASRPDNAASPIYPDGTKLLVWSPETKKTLVVRVNNAGPYYGKRTLDLSRGAAETLGFGKRGVAKLQVRVLEAPTVAEARYQKQRTYAAVPGFVGIFDSIDAALTSVGRAFASLLTPPAAASAPIASASLADRSRRPTTRLAAAHKRTKVASHGHRHSRIAAKAGRHRTAHVAARSHSHRLRIAAHRKAAQKLTSHRTKQHTPKRRYAYAAKR